MSKTISTDNILILWLLAAATAIILLVSAKWSARTHPVAPTMQWQSDSSWVKVW
jgi:biotin transporter BioY